MHKLCVALGLTCWLLVTAGASAQSPTYHQGYTTGRGTYVQPHYQTAPDANRFNNWSSRGNSNPYTGRQGTVNPYATPAPTYGSQSYSIPSYTNPYGRR